MHFSPQGLPTPSSPTVTFQLNSIIKSMCFDKCYLFSLANLSWFSAHQRARTLESLNIVYWGVERGTLQVTSWMMEVGKIKGEYGRCNVAIFFDGDRLSFALLGKTKGLLNCLIMTAGKNKPCLFDSPF